MADVNLLTKGGLDYIEIVVSPWAFPVNCDGEYHYRSGSTKQMLRANDKKKIWILRISNCWKNWT